MNTSLDIARTRDALIAQDIAARLGIPVTDVTADMHWHFAVGDMEEGAALTLWLRNYRPDTREERL